MASSAEYRHGSADAAACSTSSLAQVWPTAPWPPPEPAWPLEASGTYAKVLLGFLRRRPGARPPAAARAPRGSTAAAGGAQQPGRKRKSVEKY
eukprot:3566201-Pyramimonas_sp.AAC.1